jgi:hypothetical protein
MKYITNEKRYLSKNTCLDSEQYVFGAVRHLIYSNYHCICYQELFPIIWIVFRIQEVAGSTVATLVFVVERGEIDRQSQKALVQENARLDQYDTWNLFENEARSQIRVRAK